jgi:transposase
MKQVSTIGLDLAKNIFQVYGSDEDGSPLFNRKLRRSEVLRFFSKQPKCLVGMEACGSAHYWGRKIAELGHEVRLIPPIYVKPFVKRGKTDAADAEAIAEAVTRKTMRFVPVKTAEQQGNAMVVKARTVLVRQRTQVVNSVRSHLAELGIISADGRTSIAALLTVVRDEKDARLTAAARLALTVLADQIEDLSEKIERLDETIVAAAKADADMRRLTTIPGVGVITAATVKAFVPDPERFVSARHFSAFLGLTPQPHSSGGKERLGSISKMGNTALRTLLVVGATSVLKVAMKAKIDAGNPDPTLAWLQGLLARRPFKVVAVALANRMARIIWALLTKGGIYRRPTATATATAASPVAA